MGGIIALVLAHRLTRAHLLASLALLSRAFSSSRRLCSAARAQSAHRAAYFLLPCAPPPRCYSSRCLSQRSVRSISRLLFAPPSSLLARCGMCGNAFGEKALTLLLLSVASSQRATYVAARIACTRCTNASLLMKRLGSCSHSLRWCRAVRRLVNINNN